MFKFDTWKLITLVACPLKPRATRGTLSGFWPLSRLIVMVFTHVEPNVLGPGDVPCQYEIQQTGSVYCNLNLNKGISTTKGALYHLQI